MPAYQTVHVPSAMLIDWFFRYETRQMSYEKISQGFAVSDQAWQCMYVFFENNLNTQTLCLWSHCVHILT